MKQRIKQVISESILLKQQILSNEYLLDTVEQVAEVCTIALKADKKLLFCGNGGSAADAQHIAAEFSGRFYKDRKPFHAEALHTNASYMTAVANDYGFDFVYSRMIQAKGRVGDIFFGISTSGNSPNVVKAFEQSRKQGLINIAMTGATGGSLLALSDYVLNVPSVDTPRIQEAHIMLGHIICELVEANLTKKI